MVDQVKLDIRKAELVTFNIILKKRYYNCYVSKYT